MGVHIEVAVGVVVGVAVAVGVDVAVGVWVRVEVWVAVAVGVAVDVSVGVAVGVSVNVAVMVGVGVGDGEGCPLTRTRGKYTSFGAVAAIRISRMARPSGPARTLTRVRIFVSLFLDIQLRDTCQSSGAESFGSLASNPSRLYLDTAKSWRFQVNRLAVVVPDGLVAALDAARLWL